MNFNNGREDVMRIQFLSMISVFIIVLLSSSSVYAAIGDDKLIEDYFSKHGLLSYIQTKYETLETEHLNFTFGKRVADQLKIDMICEVRLKQPNMFLYSWPYDYDEKKYIDISRLPRIKHGFIYFDYINDPTWNGSADLLRDHLGTDGSLLYAVSYEVSQIRLVRTGKDKLVSELTGRYEYPIRLVAHIAIPVQDTFQLYTEDVQVTVELSPLTDYCYGFGEMEAHDKRFSYIVLYAKTNANRLLIGHFYPDEKLKEYKEDHQLNFLIFDPDWRSLSLWPQSQEDIPDEIQMALAKWVNETKIAVYMAVDLKRNGHYYIEQGMIPSAENNNSRQ